MVTMYCAAKLLDFAALGVPRRQHCCSTGTRTIILLIAVFLVKKEAPLTVSTDQELNVLQNEACLSCHVYWIRETGGIL